MTYTAENGAHVRKGAVREQVQGLEFLRGACAIAVALFHCLEGGGVAEMYNWGLYGVYIFFVISGAVLYYNYAGLTDPGPFLLKRFARLAPLYLLVMLIAALGQHQVIGWRHVMNVTMLFGFSNPAFSTVTGGWSLGIEFALYALFPVLLVFTRSWSTVVTTVAILLLLRISNAETAVHGSIAEWWLAYTQVGSFLFFFFGGMAIAKLMDLKVAGARLLAMIGTVCLVGVFAIPMSEYVLIGWAGAAYSVMCLPIVAWAFRWKLPGSRFLGETSYGLYLLHPLVWGTLNHGLHLSVFWRMVLTIPVSMGIAWVVLRVYETPVKRWILGQRAPLDLLPSEKDPFGDAHRG